jgi:coatomer protein complex subunit alpha (xenin)
LYAHNRLARYLADVPERIKIFEQVGQLSLAYMTAATHGLTEDAARLEAELEGAGMSKPALLPDAKLLVPPTPILRGDNWPLLTVSQGFFEGALKGGYVAEDEAAGGALDLGADDDDLDMAGGAWGEDDLDLDDDGAIGNGGGRDSALDLGDDEEGGGWGEDDDLDLDLGDEEGAESGAADSAMADALAVPSEGKPLPQLWMGNSNIAADHAAAGDFTSAMQLLHRQIGVTNFEPLRKSFMATYTGAMCSLPGLPSMPAITSYVT